MVEPVFDINEEIDDDDTEEVHLVVDDESSTDSGNYVFHNTVQNNPNAMYDSEDESDHRPSDQEDNLDNQNPQTEPILRKLKVGLDGPSWKSVGGQMVSAMIVAE